MFVGQYCSDGRICWKSWGISIIRDGLYTKKKKTTYKEQGKQKIAECIEKISGIPSNLLAYIDEAGIDCYVCRTHAWFRRRKRIYEKNYWEIAELMQYEGTMDGKMFKAWFEKLLCPAFEHGNIL